MRFHPERRTATAHFREIRTLAAVADQWRASIADFIERLNRSPKENVSSIWAEHIANGS